MFWGDPTLIKCCVLRYFEFDFLYFDKILDAFVQSSQWTKSSFRIRHLLYCVPLKVKLSAFRVCLIGTTELPFSHESIEMLYRYLAYHVCTRVSHMLTISTTSILFSLFVRSSPSSFSIFSSNYACSLMRSLMYHIDPCHGPMLGTGRPIGSRPDILFPTKMVMVIDNNNTKLKATIVSVQTPYPGDKDPHCARPFS